MGDVEVATGGHAVKDTGADDSNKKNRRDANNTTNNNNNNNNRRDKPWDNGGVDHWARDEFKAGEHGSGAFLEESSFATLFPQYRERYLRQVWKAVTASLDKHGIGCELNVVEGSMTVRTTRRTRDPFIIVKARDLIKLLARSVPLAQAVKILDDDMNCDIVKIGNFVDNKQRFVKRRERLIGPKGSTLKAVELLTGCYMLVQGNTVAVMGGFKGMKNARKIIEDCMQNVHPVYNIKRFMIMRELEKDPELSGTDWSRFLPQFKKSNSNANNKQQKKKQKKVQAEKEKKEYSAFPPLPQPSKIDKQLESGEYFLSEDARRQSKVAKQKKQREQTARLRREEKEKAYAPPAARGADEEAAAVGRKRRRRDDEGGEKDRDGDDVAELTERIKKRAKKNKKKKQAGEQSL